MGKIKSILFSINDYSHYKKCTINRFIENITNKKQIIRIEVKLVEDETEIVSFYKKFKEDYKLFKMGRRGVFTLKQIWSHVQIVEIKYNDTL